MSPNTETDQYLNKYKPQQFVDWWPNICLPALKQTQNKINHIAKKLCHQELQLKLACPATEASKSLGISDIATTGLRIYIEDLIWVLMYYWIY